MATAKTLHEEHVTPARIGEHDILDIMHDGQHIGTAQRGQARFEVLFRGVTLRRRKLSAGEAPAKKNRRKRRK